MTASTHADALHQEVPGASLLDKLNGPWHRRANWIFMAIVLAHWGEHLFQAYQVYVLHWPVPKSLGMLGYVWPRLVETEGLHYGYAIVMLCGLWILRRGFVGRARTWWMISFWIQFWHHFEHLLLQYQAIVGHNFFGSPVPISLVQVYIRRVELHLLYNGLVFLPMVIAVWYHLFPTQEEARQVTCTCAIEATPARAA
jgi:hypothetical protein